MTNKEFIIWLRGFTSGCEGAPTEEQWDLIREVLNEVEDFEEDSGIELEIDDCHKGEPMPLTGTISSSSSVGFNNPGGTTTATVWNDKMGCWHYTNYPEGFGYYTNSTLDRTYPEETKKQLLD